MCVNIITWGGMGQNLGNGWSKSIVIENEVVINFYFRHGAKNQVIWTTRCKVMAKYISIYFTKSWMTSDDQHLHQKQKYFHLWYALGYSWPSFRKILKARTPRKKCFIHKMWYFGDLGFPSVIFVNKPLKALCLSFKMVYQHLLCFLSLWTYWHLKITQGPPHFFQWEF